MNKKSLICKASGKVLIAGGYGVLQQNNYGLSLATNNNFYSITNLFQQQKQDKIRIFINSPQINKKWQYLYFFSSKIVQDKNQNKNPFLFNAVKYSFIYLSNKNINLQSLSIIILFDQGFLSGYQDQKKQKFGNYSEGSSKTGLGSSACVTVVVVKGILESFIKDVSINAVNCVSQVANLSSQQKIGSNFDISTAVYGSHLYKNVLPKFAYKVTQSCDFSQLQQIDPEITYLDVSQQFKNKSKSWLLDLKIGSDTRQMVSGFKNKLHILSQYIILQFYTKNKIIVKQIFDIITSKISIKQIQLKLKDKNKEYRTFLQYYSKITNVSVQPCQFKKFLDQISMIQQIIYVICPGSGGYDAIFVLGLFDHKQKLNQIKQMILNISLTNKIECRLIDTEIKWNNQKISKQEEQNIYKFISNI